MRSIRDVGISLVGTIFKEYYNVFHYIAYSFRRTGFFLIHRVSARPFKGKRQGKPLSSSRTVRGLILSACSFLFSVCYSDPATSQLLQSAAQCLAKSEHELNRRVPVLGPPVSRSRKPERDGEGAFGTFPSLQVRSSLASSKNTLLIKMYL